MVVGRKLSDWEYKRDLFLSQILLFSVLLSPPPLSQQSSLFILKSALQQVLFGYPPLRMPVQFLLVSRASWVARSNARLAVVSTPLSYTAVGGFPTVTLNNTLLMFGGVGNSTTLINDTWATTTPDRAGWALMSGVDMASGRVSPSHRALYTFAVGTTGCASSTAATSPLLVVMAGYLSPVQQWMYSRDGLNYTTLTSAPWSPRSTTMCLVLPCTVATPFCNSSVLLLSGLPIVPDVVDPLQPLNDVWDCPVISSSNLTSCWTQVTSRASWPGRDGAMGVASTANTTVVSSGVLVYIMGGSQRQHQHGSGDYTGSNDIWASSDRGVTWTLVTAAAPWNARATGSVAVSSTGILVLSEGQYAPTDSNDSFPHDVWASLDGGVTWGQCSNSSTAAYAARSHHATVLDEKDFLYMAAGIDVNFFPLNDVFRSTIAFRDAATVAAACAPLAIPTCGPGPQCWPPSTQCPPCQVASRSSSTSTPPTSAPRLSSSSSTSMSSATSSMFLSGGDFSSTASISASQQLSLSSVAGIVIAVVIVTVLLLGLLVWACHKRWRERKLQPTRELIELPQLRPQYEELSYEPEDEPHMPFPKSSQRVVAITPDGTFLLPPQTMEGQPPLLFAPYSTLASLPNGPLYFLAVVYEQAAYQRVTVPMQPEALVQSKHGHEMFLDANQHLNIFQIRLKSVIMLSGIEVQVESDRGSETRLAQATAFLVSPRLLMTNHHVLESSTAASKRAVKAHFDFVNHGGPDHPLIGPQSPCGPTARLKPDLFFWTIKEPFDVTIVAFEYEETEDDTLVVTPKLPPGVREPIPLRASCQGRDDQEDGLWMLSHPLGRSIQLTQGRLVEGQLIHRLTTSCISYDNDTLRGSSGAPVLNKAGQLVGLHCRGAFDKLSGKGHHNEGTHVGRIYWTLLRDLEAALRHDNTRHRQLRPSEIPLLIDCLLLDTASSRTRRRVQACQKIWHRRSQN